MKQFYILFYFVFLFSSLMTFSMEPELMWEKQGEFTKTNAFVFSRDGKFIYVQSHYRISNKESYEIQKWNIEEKKIIQTFECTTEYDKMVLSNDENLIAGVNEYSTIIQILDITNKDDVKITDFEHYNKFNFNAAIAFSEDNKSIYFYNNQYKIIYFVTTQPNVDHSQQFYLKRKIHQFLF